MAPSNAREPGKDAVWLDEAHAYAVVSFLGAVMKSERSGMSHADAMTLAEKLYGEGKRSAVLHIVGDKSYEVDRYPAR